MTDRGDRCPKCDCSYRYVMRIEDDGMMRDIMGCRYCVALSVGPYSTVNDISGKLLSYDVISTQVVFNNSWRGGVKRAVIHLPDDHASITLGTLAAKKLKEWILKATSGNA